MTDPAITLQAPLVVRSPNWLGDVVMALPAVRNLKSMLGEDQLVVAAPEKLVALWQKCPFVDRVLSLDQPKKLRVTVEQLRAGQFGSAVLLPNSLRAAAEARLAGIPQRIGYAKGGRGMLLSRAIPAPLRDPARLHQKYYYLDLVAAIGGPTDPALPRLRKEPTSLGSGPRGVIIAMCPGAEYGPAKRWPAQNFATVAKYFVETRHARVVLLGAPGDALIADQIASMVPEVENLAGRTTLDEFMAQLVSARLVVCNDSGAMHVASALGVPTLAVFGSTEPELTGPMGARARVLRHHVPCSPCFLRDCPIDFACMNNITAEAAISSAEILLR